MLRRPFPLRDQPQDGIVYRIEFIQDMGRELRGWYSRERKRSRGVEQRLAMSTWREEGKGMGRGQEGARE